MLLETIEHANDIKKIRKEDLNILAQEIRDFLIRTISVTGGHLGSNLGAVELTMALHLALNLPEDKIIWDVGHQSYTHKILTGRKDGFESLRQFHGLSGFPKRKESDCDVFDTGHSSTSVSAGLGLVMARDITGGKHTIVSVIGDGSLTGGMAYEALNNAAKQETNFIIILNDNKMSISENVGGVSKYLNNIRTASGYLDLKKGIYNALQRTKRGDSTISRIRRAKSSFKQLVIPGMLFEDMGITYLGPVDGHDISSMVSVINDAKRVEGPVMIHVLTQKGRGYKPAERHPARFHGAEPFDIETGIPSHPRTVANYTDIFSTVMCKLGQRDEKIVAITAAMPDGTGLKRFAAAGGDYGLRLAVGLVEREVEAEGAPRFYVVSAGYGISYGTFHAGKEDGVVNRSRRRRGILVIETGTQVEVGGGHRDRIAGQGTQIVGTAAGKVLRETVIRAFRIRKCQEGAGNYLAAVR